MGCGTVFVNYDGQNKHHTNVGEYSFIGSGSNIIAPVEIADHAYVAARSTITDDVASRDMAIARGRQVNKPGYYDRYPVAKGAAESKNRLVYFKYKNLSKKLEMLPGQFFPWLSDF